jgi:hypothetical protein
MCSKAACVPLGRHSLKSDRNTSAPRKRLVRGAGKPVALVPLRTSVITSLMRGCAAPDYRTSITTKVMSSC